MLELDTLVPFIPPPSSSLAPLPLSVDIRPSSTSSASPIFSFSSPTFEHPDLPDFQCTTPSTPQPEARGKGTGSSCTDFLAMSPPDSPLECPSFTSVSFGDSLFSPHPHPFNALPPHLQPFASLIGHLAELQRHSTPLYCNIAEYLPDRESSFLAAGVERWGQFAQRAVELGIVELREEGCGNSGNRTMRLTRAFNMPISNSPSLPTLPPAPTAAEDETLRPFRPLINLLLSLPFDPPPRQISVYEKLPISDEVLDEVGATDWMAYVERAEELGIVEMDAEANWVSLTAAYRPPPLPTATSLRSTAASSSPSTTSVSSILPFHPLIRILKIFPNEHAEPRDAAFECFREIGAGVRRAYAKAGVEGFGAYCRTDVKAGVVRMDGWRWIELTGLGRSVDV
jgi:hypothetical protein